MRCQVKAQPDRVGLRLFLSPQRRIGSSADRDVVITGHGPLDDLPGQRPRERAVDCWVEWPKLIKPTGSLQFEQGRAIIFAERDGQRLSGLGPAASLPRRAECGSFGRATPASAAWAIARRSASSSRRRIPLVNGSTHFLLDGLTWAWRWRTPARQGTLAFQPRASAPRAHRVAELPCGAP